MEIILNEYEWAEKAIADRRLGVRPTETLTRIAKYYFANQYSRRDVRSKLDIFLTQCDPDASLVQWSDTLDRIVKAAAKRDIIKVDGVSLSSSELDRIDQIEGKQLRRLAFAMLCVAKYWDAVSPNNNHWLNAQDKDVFALANIRTSGKRQCIMYGELRDLGLIRFSKKVDNLNVQVVFADDELSEPEMIVTDFRNLGYQYLRRTDDNYFECTNCGVIERKNTNHKGRRQKYCASCAAEIRTKQSIDSVMRARCIKENASVGKNDEPQMPVAQGFEPCLRRAI